MTTEQTIAVLEYEIRLLDLIMAISPKVSLIGDLSENLGALKMKEKVLGVIASNEARLSEIKKEAGLIN